MVFHLIEGTAVHLGYVAVKLTIIFTTIFLTTWLIGRGKQEGIFACLIGPIAFYIYYLFATPTLNRAVFKIDEQFWYAFLHMIFFGIAYFLTQVMIVKKKYGKNLQAFGRGFSTALGVIALDFVYLLARVWSSPTGNEEMMATTLHPIYAVTLLCVLTLIYFICYRWVKSMRSVLMAIIPAVLVWRWGIETTSIHGIAIAGIVLVVYWLQRQVGK